MERKESDSVLARKEPKPNNMTIRYTVRMNDDEDKKVNAYCEKSGKNRSDVIREAISRLIHTPL